MNRLSCNNIARLSNVKHPCGMGGLSQTFFNVKPTYTLQIFFKRFFIFLNFPFSIFLNFLKLEWFIFFKNCKYFLIFLLLIFIPYSNSQVWVKDSKMEFYKFKSHILSAKKGDLSYADYVLQKQRDISTSFKLKNKVLKAQEYYLSGETDSALKSFKEIASLSLSADWNEDQRRAIFYSLLRLAQKEKNKNKRRALLISASQFITEKITKDYPDYNLFPPPLLEQLREIQDNQIFLFVDWKEIFPHHEIILINGRQISIEKNSSVPEGSYRITALSSSHAPWIKIIPLSRLIIQNIKTSSLSSGYCKKLKIKNKWMKKNIKIFKEPCKTNHDANFFIKRSEGSLAQNKSNSLNKNFKTSLNQITQNNFWSNSNKLLGLNNLEFNKKNLTQLTLATGLVATLAYIIYTQSKNKPRNNIIVF